MIERGIKERREESLMKDYVQFGPTGLVIQIFRNKKAAVMYVGNPNRGLALDPVLGQLEHKLAVGHVRKQVFERDGYICVHCGKAVVWESGLPNSGELDEKQARGDCQKGLDGHYHSGAISVANCQTLCHNCHQGQEGKHQRQPQWSSGPGL